MGGDDEDPGVCSAPALCGAGIYVPPIPAENQPGLIADLEGDPFVRHVLRSATCELYHRYGMFLASLMQR